MASKDHMTKIHLFLYFKLADIIIKLLKFFFIFLLLTTLIILQGKTLKVKKLKEIN